MCLNLEGNKTLSSSWKRETVAFVAIDGFYFLCSFMGKGVIKLKPADVWQAVRDHMTRYVYDKMLKVTTEACQSCHFPR